jgi:hypothetical protein
MQKEEESELKFNKEGNTKIYAQKQAHTYILVCSNN